VFPLSNFVEEQQTEESTDGSAYVKGIINGNLGNPEFQTNARRERNMQECGEVSLVKYI
jgi:hypothetical protein